MKPARQTKRATSLKFSVLLFLGVGILYPLIAALASGTADEPAGNAPA